MPAVKKKCTLCSSPVQESELLAYFLGDRKLLNFIERHRREWQNGMPICASCLEDYKRQLQQQIESGSLSDAELSGERTVITALDDGAANLPVQEQLRASLLV